MLNEGNLSENVLKREEYHVPEDVSWKKCKCLGSLMDTEEDINRRKGIAIGALRTLEPIMKSHTTSIHTKLKVFNAYVQSIFLYNSELWTVTKSTISRIDSFQRRLMRQVVGVRWPKVMKNDELYQLTKAEKWSVIIKKRRLSWLGHMLRLNEETPVKKALEEYLRKIKKKKGKRKTQKRF